MNCATHNEVAALAYCRTCGKPLCATCTRDVRGVIYCENCLADRLQGVQPALAAPTAGFVPSAVGPVAAGRTPSPGLAAFLGFIPGVGAAYNGQFMKGFIHAISFVILIFLADRYGPITVPLFFFYFFYTSIEAYKTARALEMQEPVPDPFGLNRTFGSGAATSSSSNVPAGALILIGLGLLFMLHNMGFWFFSMDRLWPIILIVIGGWLFARRWGVLGAAGGTCGCARCRARCLMGPTVLVTLGVLFLLEAQDIVSFGRTWPVLLLVIGLVKLLQGSASSTGHVAGPPAIQGSAASPTGTTGEVQPPSSEVKHG